MLSPPDTAQSVGAAATIDGLVELHRFCPWTSRGRKRSTYKGGHVSTYLQHLSFERTRRSGSHNSRLALQPAREREAFVPAVSRWQRHRSGRCAEERRYAGSF